MDRIIKITDEKVIVGTKLGGILEIRRSDLDFEPEVGDAVNVYTSESQTIIAKIFEYEKDGTSTKGNLNEKQGINININNQNASNNSGVVEGHNGKKVVNKVAYVLLAIFLGGLGIHKFYSGKTALGVLYILFCWTFIPSLIALIEAIIAISKTSDVYGNIVI